MNVTIKGDKAIELSKMKRPKLASITSACIDGKNIAQLNIIEEIVVKDTDGEKKQK